VFALSSQGAPRINAFQRSSQKSALPVMSQTKSSTTSKAILKPTYKPAAIKRSPIKDKTHGVRRSDAMRPPFLRSTLIFCRRANQRQVRGSDQIFNELPIKVPFVVRQCRPFGVTPNWIKFDHAGVESLRKAIYSLACRGKGRRFLIVRHHVTLLEGHYVLRHAQHGNGGRCSAAPRTGLNGGT
jgi:hypothetical protein